MKARVTDLTGAQLDSPANEWSFLVRTHRQGRSTGAESSIEGFAI